MSSLAFHFELFQQKICQLWICLQGLRRTAQLCERQNFCCYQTVSLAIVGFKFTEMVKYIKELPAIPKADFTDEAYFF